MPPESIVRVNAGRVGPTVLINVIDEGREYLEAVKSDSSEPFQRLGDRINKSGVGLGLSVARGFVEAMDGTISATDTRAAASVIVELLRRWR